MKPKTVYLDADGNPTKDPKADVWAQYTFDETYDPADPDSVNKWINPGHAVCIVGYDDNFPKECFYDPNGTIGGDGAFLVRNSEGSSGNSNPEAVSDWGNGGSGYFWLSYYDQSIVYCESFDFFTDTASGAVPDRIDMYDFMPDYRQLAAVFGEDIRMANVFEAKEDCVVQYTGFETAYAEIDVEYSVYLLNPGAKHPADGTLVAERSAHYTYAGYHTTDLGETARIPAGSRYSVIVRAGAGGKSELSVALDLNLAGVRFYSQEKLNHYAETVVNPGESFVGSGDEWTDWTEIIRRLETMNADLNNSGFTYDNFPIRSYTCAE